MTPGKTRFWTALGYLFIDLFQIHGAVMESSESLLLTGRSRGGI